MENNTIICNVCCGNGKVKELAHNWGGEPSVLIGICKACSGRGKIIEDTDERFDLLKCTSLPPERNEEGFRTKRTEVILLDNKDLNHRGYVFLKEKNSTKDLDFIHFNKGRYLERMGHIVVFTNTYTGAQKLLKCRYA